MGPWHPLLARLDHATIPAAAAERWGVDPATLRLAQQGANIVYRGERDGAGVYLKLNHERLRGYNERVAVAQYHAHCAANGASVSEPLPSRDGRFVEAIDQGPDRFLATAEREAPGETFAAVDRGDAAFRATGRAIASIHVAAATFRPSTGHAYYSWERELANIARWLPPDDAPARREEAAVREFLTTLDPSGPGFGLTHGDLNMGNVLCDGQTATIVDFDEPMWNWFAADVVRPMRDFEDLPLQRRRQVLAAIVQGYRGVRPLDDPWLEALPMLFRFKQLEIYAWLVGDPKAADSTIPGRDEFVGVMRHRFASPLEF